MASPPVSSATASTASAAPSLATVYPVGADGAIVFYRPAEDDPNPISNAGTPFAILPDGSNEVRLGADLPAGVWSPDGSRLAFPRFVPAVSPVPGGQADWMRPVVMTADGSMRLLAADSPRSMHLIPLAWTADGSALYVLGGSEAVEPSDRGLFTVRASDGGNLRRLPIATREGFDQEFDVVGGGSTILVKEIEPRSDGPDHSILYSFDRRLHTLRRLTQTASAMSVVNLEFFPSAVEDVSPDGSQVAFCEFVTADYETSMFLERPDGSGLRRLVGPDVGAISARWSPDGKQIAFTGEKDRDNQIWVVRPDGSGLRQLTDGAGGALSIIPVWSPDGSRLLFQRKQGATLTLWTMNADGSDQRQLSPTPISLGADGQKDWTGPYAWWAPPTA